MKDLPLKKIGGPFIVKDCLSENVDSFNLAIKFVQIAPALISFSDSFVNPAFSNLSNIGNVFSIFVVTYFKEVGMESSVELFSVFFIIYSESYTYL